MLISPRLHTSISLFRCDTPKYAFKKKQWWNLLSWWGCRLHATKRPSFYNSSCGGHFKKRSKSLTCVSVRFDTLGSCRKMLQKDGALHRGTTCLFHRYKGLIRGNEDAIFLFYLTQWTFKINTPVNVKTAPNWSLVDTRLLLKPKDDQHKQWHCNDNSVRAGIWKFF